MFTPLKGAQQFLSSVLLPADLIASHGEVKSAPSRVLLPADLIASHGVGKSVLSYVLVLTDLMNALEQKMGVVAAELGPLYLAEMLWSFASLQHPIHTSTQQVSTLEGNGNCQ